MSIKFLLVLLLAAAGLAAAGMSPIRLLRADRVRSLMKKTGSDAVTIVAVIIGAECAMCERAEYDFLQLYSAFEDVPGVVFGYIDASKEPETAAMFGYRPGDVPPLLYIHNPETGLLSCVARAPAPAHRLPPPATSALCTRWFICRLPTCGPLAPCVARAGTPARSTRGSCARG